MAGQNSELLKSYFQRKKKPKVEHFEALVDSLFEKAQSVLPKVNAQYNLGSSDYTWADIFSGRVTTSELLINGRSSTYLGERNILTAYSLDKIDLENGTPVKGYFTEQLVQDGTISLVNGNRIQLPVGGVYDIDLQFTVYGANNPGNIYTYLRWSEDDGQTDIPLSGSIDTFAADSYRTITKRFRVQIGGPRKIELDFLANERCSISKFDDLDSGLPAYMITVTQVR
jgi:hypothetical protein